MRRTSVKPTRSLMTTALLVICLMCGSIVSAQPRPLKSIDKFSLWTGPTQLRGANIHQRHVYPELDGPEFMGPGPFGPPYSQADFNRLAEWGVHKKTDFNESTAALFSPLLRIHPFSSPSSFLEPTSLFFQIEIDP